MAKWAMYRGVALKEDRYTWVVLPGVVARQYTAVVGTYYGCVASTDG